MSPAATDADKHERPRAPVLPRVGTNALVVVRSGDVEGAIRQLRRQVENSGVKRLLNRRWSRLYTYYPPGQRRRMKRRTAAKRRVKWAQQRAWLDARELQIGL